MYKSKHESVSYIGLQIYTSYCCSDRRQNQFNLLNSVNGIIEGLQGNTSNTLRLLFTRSTISHTSIQFLISLFISLIVIWRIRARLWSLDAVVFLWRTRASVSLMTSPPSSRHRSWHSANMNTTHMTANYSNYPTLVIQL